jgi:hypothetical protein
MTVSLSVTLLLITTLLLSTQAERAHKVGIYEGSGECLTFPNFVDIQEGACWTHDGTSSLKLSCGPASLSPTGGNIISYHGSSDCNESENTVPAEAKPFKNGECLVNAAGEQGVTISCYQGSEVHGGGGGDDSGGGSPSGAESPAPGGASSGALEARETALKAVLGVALGFVVVAALARR